MIGKNPSKHEHLFRVAKYQIETLFHDMSVDAAVTRSELLVLRAEINDMLSALGDPSVAALEENKSLYRLEISDGENSWYEEHLLSSTDDAQRMIDSFNASLRPWEKPRTLIRVEEVK